MSGGRLISIQPPHTDNIFSGIKDIEWRHSCLPTGKYYCYETKNGGGCGKVVGEFTIWKVRQYEDVSHVCDEFVRRGCVSRKFLEKYCDKNRRIAANFIVRPIRYDKPKELSEFKGRTLAWRGNNHVHVYETIIRPPQSWCYVEGSADNG